MLRGEAEVLPLCVEEIKQTRAAAVHKSPWLFASLGTAHSSAAAWSGGAGGHVGLSLPFNVVFKAVRRSSASNCSREVDRKRRVTDDTSLRKRIEMQDFKSPDHVISYVSKDAAHVQMLELHRKLMTPFEDCWYGVWDLVANDRGKTCTFIPSPYAHLVILPAHYKLIQNYALC